MILVLNEWVFHDLLGDNGEAVQRQTAAFLNDLHTSHDKLVLPREPRWSHKAYQLMTQGDARLRNISKQFHSLIRDSGRAVDVRTAAHQEVPEELRDSLPAEDVYLIEAYLSGEADTLVTTDERLHEALSGSEAVSCQLREEFLKGYRP